MRYGIIPTRLAERLALWFGGIPRPIADCLLPLLQTRSLMAAVRLGIVDAMAGERCVSTADIARACSLDAAPLDLMLRVLVSAGYVEGGRGRYRLSATGRRTLLPTGRDPARSYVLLNYVQWEFVEHLEELLRSGRGLDFHETMADEEKWRWYQQAMLDLSRASAPYIARRVPVPRGARVLVDVGGSHGLLGAAICRRHPPMRSVVLDLPAGIDAARAASRAAGIDDVVEHRAVDAREEPVPAPADVVLVANLLHHFGRDEATAVMDRSWAALSPGGTIALWEFDRPAPDAPPELAGDAAALYFRLTSTADLVPAVQYADWLRAAGFVEVRISRSALAPMNVLIIGRKPPPVRVARGDATRGRRAFEADRPE